MKKFIIAFLTIIRKEVIRVTRQWTQTLLPPVITTVLYFAIFGHVLGPRLGLIQGVNYMQYIAPGLIMMSVINNAYMNASFSLYIMRFTKSIEEILVAPVPNYLILIGFTSAAILRGLIVGLLVTVVALFFTHFHIHHYFMTFCVIFLSALLFSLAGILNALYARNFDDTTIIPTFVLTPLTYLGGIFYPIALLPSIWHTLSLFNPILYMVNTFRYGFLGISDISVTVGIFILIACSSALAITNLYLLNKGTGLRT